MKASSARPAATTALAAALVLTSLVLVPDRADAGPLACGAVITESVTLTADVGPCDGPGLRIGADGVHLSLGGRSVIGNFDRGEAGEHVGIDLTGRSGVTVTRGRVAGFEAGVVIDRGGGNAIRNLTIEDNVGPQNLLFAGLGDGVAVFESAGNILANNRIRGNGHFDGVAVLGAGADRNILVNNVVENNFGAGEDLAVGSGFGIIFNAFLSFPSPTPSVSLVGNVVRGNSVIGNDTSGITSINNIDGVIENNQAVNNGRGLTALDSGYGSGIDLEHRPTATTQTNMLIQGNRATGNGVSGIRLGSNSLANRVLGNDARGNGNFVRPGYGWDLHDENPGCAGNHWGVNAYRTLFQGCEAGVPVSAARSRAAKARTPEPIPTPSRSSS